MSLARQATMARPAMLYAGDGLRKPVRVAWTPADLLAALAAAAVIAIPTLLVGALLEHLLLGGRALDVPGRLMAAVAALAVLYGSLFAGTALFTVAKYRLPWDILRFRPVSRQVYLAMVPALAVVDVASGCLGWALAPLAGKTAELANPQVTAVLSSFSVSWGGFAGCLFIVAVAAPIAEETYFRGMIYILLRERFGMWPAVGISSVIFGAAHLFVYGRYIVIAFPQLVLLGVVLALVVERTRSLYPAMLLHGLNNGVVVIILFGGAAMGGGPVLGA